MGYRISVVAGGPFADIAVLAPDGRMPIGKALTTTERIFEGMAGGLGVVAPTPGLTTAGRPGPAETLIHGTTRATNAGRFRRLSFTHAENSVAGGLPGTPDATWPVRGDGAAARLPGVVQVTPRPRRAPRGRDSAGGGYGDPLARDVHGVVFTGTIEDETLAVDAAATAALRAGRKACAR